MALRADQSVRAVDGPVPLASLVHAFGVRPDLTVPVFTWKEDRIAVGLLRGIRRVGIAETLRVELDDGNSVVCTADSELVLRDGQPMKPAGLIAGVSLLPLYIHNDTYGYPVYKNIVLDPKAESTWKKVSWLVGEWKYGGPLPKGTVVRYLSKDRTNVHPDNLEVKLNARSPKRKMNYGISEVLGEAAELFEEAADLGERFQRIIDDNNHKVVGVTVMEPDEVFDLDVDGATVAVSGVFIRHVG